MPGGRPKGTRTSPEGRARMSAAHIGLVKTPEWKSRITASLNGRTLSAEHRQHLSEARRGLPMSKPRSLEHTEKLSGRNHWNWRGGISGNGVAEDFINWKRWKRAVHRRDNRTCQICGATGLRGMNLQADHILPKRDYPELRWSIDNGRTLCQSCHLGVTGVYLKKLLRDRGTSERRAANRI